MGEHHHLRTLLQLSHTLLRKPSFASLTACSRRHYSQIAAIPYFGLCLHIIRLGLPRVAREPAFEQIAPFKVSVGVNDRVQVRGFPCAVVFDLSNLSFMCPFEHAITCNVKSFLFHVFLHSPEDIAIADTGDL